MTRPVWRQSRVTYHPPCAWLFSIATVCVSKVHPKWQVLYNGVILREDNMYGACVSEEGEGRGLGDGLLVPVPPAW